MFRLADHIFSPLRALPDEDLLLPKADIWSAIFRRVALTSLK